MKTVNIALLTLLLFLATLTGCDSLNWFDRWLKPQITICDLLEEQSFYADTLIELQHVTLIKCSGFLRVYVAEISDGNCTITFLTNKPYRTGERATVKGRLQVLYMHQSSSYSVFVDEKMID